MMQKWKQAVFTILAVIVASVGAACLSGAAQADEMQIINMDIKDGVITPNRIDVAAGATFKIVVTNSGSSPAEFESLRLHREKVLAPGVTSFVVIRRLSAGTYEFYDEFHMDQETANGVIVAK
ncbi:cupredoxin domain-containing protein [Thalassospira sp. MCCC 1A01428]|uniref:cupredoxin domain-containing protein n=1 Tax=Thalassospira sp. MCCC 1A01428 TaxID=1470575 RepID=UPI001AEF4269|nr:cupredoxin domain-containing protein [Thalassospira sp. MCCC 1A01428]